MLNLGMGNMVVTPPLWLQMRSFFPSIRWYLFLLVYMQVIELSQTWHEVRGLPSAHCFLMCICSKRVSSLSFCFSFAWIAIVISCPVYRCPICLQLLIQSPTSHCWTSCSPTMSCRWIRSCIKFGLWGDSTYHIGSNGGWEESTVLSLLLECFHLYCHSRPVETKFVHIIINTAHFQGCKTPTLILKHWSSARFSYTVQPKIKVSMKKLMIAEAVCEKKMHLTNFAAVFMLVFTH